MKNNYCQFEYISYLCTSKNIVMPEISKFFGIFIYMYIGDHNPPHFHVWYEGDEATIDIAD